MQAENNQQVHKYFYSDIDAANIDIKDVKEIEEVKLMSPVDYACCTREVRQPTGRILSLKSHHWL